MTRRALLALVPYLGAYVGGVLPALALYVSLSRDPRWSLALAAVPVAALAGYHLAHLGVARAIRRRRAAELGRETHERSHVAPSAPAQRRGLAPGDRVGEPVQTERARRDPETEPTPEDWTGEVQNPTTRVPRRRHAPTTEPHRTTSADPRRRTR